MVDPTETPKPQPETPKEEQISTQHVLNVNGEAIAYTAVAGTMVLKAEDGTIPKASVFFIAYTRDRVEDPSKRPITFSFNGGPGSSSIWMHLGLLGPRRVRLAEDGGPVSPPYQLVDNAFSLLGETDLVFIDPVSTGYSRPTPGEEAKQFHGLERDAEWMGEFIRLFTTRFQRWSSPKFLIGESYGTTRAAALAGTLQNRHSLYLNGIMLISTVLNFQSVSFHTGNDLPYILFLPTYTATAWYHGCLPEALQNRPLRDLLDEVELFARTEYTLALMQGARLPAGEQAALAKRLAAYTGLSEDYISQTNLRINIYRFVKELLRRERRTVGRLDSRFKGMDRDAAGEHFEYDPSYAVIQGAYAATLNDYVRRELQFTSDLPYEVLTSLHKTWDYSNFQNQYVNVAETLRAAMCQNPYLQIFIANGYYDFATPYFATEYTFNHLELDAELQGNISMNYYEAGHMMYVHQPSLVQLHADLAAFIQRSKGTPETGT